MSRTEPPSITLLTVIGIPRGEGAHSALLINGSQRIIFDGAGSWNHPAIPGLRRALRDHAELQELLYRLSRAQSLWVAGTPNWSRGVANAAIRAAEAQGATDKSFCAVVDRPGAAWVPGFGRASGFAAEDAATGSLTLPGVTSKESGRRSGQPQRPAAPEKWRRRRLRPRQPTSRDEVKAQIQRGHPRRDGRQHIAGDQPRPA